MPTLVADLSQNKAVSILRFLYPVWAGVGLFSLMYVPTTLIAPGDATATAGNILDNELLFRLGIVGSLVTQLIQVVAALVLYKLFKPVNENHASLLVVFALVGVPVSMINVLNRVAALSLLKGADFAQVVGPEQAQAQMMFFLDLNAQGIFISGIFWGLWLFPLGYLVYRSGYVPKVLGVLLVLGGIGYLLESSMSLLFGSAEALLFVIVPLQAFGELLFMGWIVVRGARVPELE